MAAPEVNIEEQRDLDERATFEEWWASFWTLDEHSTQPAIFEAAFKEVAWKSWQASADLG